MAYTLSRLECREVSLFGSAAWCCLQVALLLDLLVRRELEHQETYASHSLSFTN